MEFKWNEETKPPVSKIILVKEIKKYEITEKVYWIVKLWYSLIKRPLKKYFNYEITVCTEERIGFCPGVIIGILELGLDFYVTSAIGTEVKFHTLHNIQNILSIDSLMDTNLGLISKPFIEGV